MARAEDVPGMAKFVEQRNAEGTKRNASLDDLKVSMKSIKASAANTLEARSSGNKPQSNRQNAPRTLQDTDTSLGKTSVITDNTSRAHSAGGNHRGVHETVQSYGPFDALYDREEFESCSASSDEYDEEQGMPEQLTHGAKARQTTAAHGDAPHASHAKPDGRNLGRISGDTYPETTSGRPSTTNADDHHEHNTAVYSQTNGAQPITMPERGAGTRLVYPPQNLQLPQHGVSRQQQIITPPPRPEEVLKEVQSGFSYGVAALNKTHPARTQPAPPPTSRHRSTKLVGTSSNHQDLPTSSKQLPMKEIRNEQLTQQTRTGPHYADPVPSNKPHSESVRHYAAPEPQTSRLQPQPPRQQHRHHDDKSPAAQVAEASQTGMTFELGNGNNNNSIACGDSVETLQGNIDTVPLDYDPPGLYGKTFTELKAASFDANPNVAEPDFMSVLQPDDTLPKKLQALLPMDERVKQDFFASLGIEEWEDVGDWFLDSFSKLTDRFKIARREKRKMAHEFENEVEMRHDSISKKQRLTAGALNEMKESGGKVLQSTPKKGPRPVK